MSFLLIIFTKNQHVLWYCVTFYFIKYVAVAAVIALRLTKRKRLRHSVRFVNKWLRKKLNMQLFVTSYYIRCWKRGSHIASVIIFNMSCLLYCNFKRTNKRHSEVVSLIASSHIDLSSCNISVKLTNKRALYTIYFFHNCFII